MINPLQPSAGLLLMPLTWAAEREGSGLANRREHDDLDRYFPPAHVEASAPTGPSLTARISSWLQARLRHSPEPVPRSTRVSEVPHSA